MGGNTSVCLNYFSNGLNRELLFELRQECGMNAMDTFYRMTAISNKSIKADCASPATLSFASVRAFTTAEKMKDIYLEGIKRESFPWYKETPTGDSNMIGGFMGAAIGVTIAEVINQVRPFTSR
jgi:hypothetical protein